MRIRGGVAIVSRQEKAVVEIDMFANQRERGFLKEEEFEHVRNIDSRCHAMGAVTWSAQEPCSFLHCRFSQKNMIYAGFGEECKKRLVV